MSASLWAYEALTRAASALALALVAAELCVEARLEQFERLEWQEY